MSVRTVTQAELADASGIHRTTINALLKLDTPGRQEATLMRLGEAILTVKREGANEQDKMMSAILYHFSEDPDYDIANEPRRDAVLDELRRLQLLAPKQSEEMRGYLVDPQPVTHPDQPAPHSQPFNERERALMENPVGRAVIALMSGFDQKQLDALHDAATSIHKRGHPAPKEGLSP